MKLCLQDIISDMEQIQTVHVAGLEFSITFFLGGDWKFLAMITGIDSASSNYACIWCKCPSLERYDTTQTWSILDPTQGARTIEENISIARSRKHKFNISRQPLFPAIPLTRVIVDNLHMFLRVADVLVDLFMMELREKDCIDKATKLKKLDCLRYLKKYEDAVKGIGISGFSFWLGRESKVLKYRSLTGPEKLRLFDMINLIELFPDIRNVDKIQALWKDLLSINCFLSVRPENLTAEHATNFETRQGTLSKHFQHSTLLNTSHHTCTA